MTANEAALFLIDYIDTYFEEFLLEEDEELYLPIDWAKHTYEAVEFEVKGQIKNEKLEDMADDLLRESGFLMNSIIKKLSSIRREFFYLVLTNHGICFIFIYRN